MTTITDICEVVAAEFNVTVQDILGPRRLKHFVVPRQIASYFAHEIFKHSKSRIAQRLHRDHTTILHGIRRTKEVHIKEHKHAIARILSALGPAKFHKPDTTLLIFRTRRREGMQ